MAFSLLSQDTPKTSDWADVLERLGVPVFLILFGCLIVWKLLPHVINWFTSATKSHGIVADAVPEIRDSLKKLANEGNVKLDAIDRRTQVIETRMESIESRLSEHHHQHNPPSG